MDNMDTNSDLSMIVEKRKTVRSTKQQIKILNDYMNTNKSFANNEYTGPLGNIKYKAQWEELQSMLREHGPDKTIEQWRHTWQDLKKKARNEVARARQAHSQTGNIVSVPKVTEDAIKILDTIGHECTTGIGGEESGIGDLDFELPPPPEFVDTGEVWHGEHTSPQPGQSDGYRPQPRQSGNRPVSPVQPLPGPSRAQQPLPGPSRELQPLPGPSRQQLGPMRPRAGQAVRHTLRPVPSDRPQKRRTGLGVRARDFLKAEEDMNTTLKDIVNLMAARNQLLDEQNDLIKKYFENQHKDNAE